MNSPGFDVLFVAGLAMVGVVVMASGLVIAGAIRTALRRCAEDERMEARRVEADRAWRSDEALAPDLELWPEPHAEFDALARERKAREALAEEVTVEKLDRWFNLPAAPNPRRIA